MTENTRIELTVDGIDTHILYTTDSSIPSYTNGYRYDVSGIPVPSDILIFTIKAISY